MMNVATRMNSLIMTNKYDTETDANSLSSTASDQEFITVLVLNDINFEKPLPQLFQLKYEGKYIDFIPYKGTYTLKQYPIEQCNYDSLPKEVFGKIEIKDKRGNDTIYGTFKKKYIRVKK